MKTSDRIALIYGASLLGAGVVSFWRGRRGQDLIVDVAFHGALAGTALNVVGYLLLRDGTAIPLFAVANEGVKGMGNTPKVAVKLLEDLDVGNLYANLKENGVTIAEIPKNPSVVVQDEN